MSNIDNEETGTGKIHPREAHRANKIDWDLKEVRYKGRLSNGTRVWGEKIYESEDEKFEKPIGEKIEIVDVKPDPKPKTPDPSEL